MVFNSETNIYFYVTEEERLVDCSEREMKVQDKFHFPAADQLQSRYQELGSMQGKVEKSDRQNTGSSEHPILFSAIPKEMKQTVFHILLCCTVDRAPLICFNNKPQYHQSLLICPRPLSGWATWEDHQKKKQKWTRYICNPFP